MARFNLLDGDVSVTINGLSKDETWDVWMVDSAAGRSIALENDDNMLRIGSLNQAGKAASLVAHLGRDAFAAFNMDLIIVTKAGKNPIEDRTLIGTTSLFHRVYRQPADLVPGQLNPQDGGFGRLGVSPIGGFGNGSFNTPVLVEAADTGPFFHNNSIETIEGAVDFYNSTAFNTSPGFGALIGGIKLEATEVVAVAAMLRAINVLENERSARDLIERIKIANNTTQAQQLAELAMAEIDDAVEVLVGGGLHRKAQKEFTKARRNAKQAGDAPNASQRISEANQALGFLSSARADIIDP